MFTCQKFQGTRKDLNFLFQAKQLVVFMEDGGDANFFLGEIKGILSRSKRCTIILTVRVSIHDWWGN